MNRRNPDFLAIHWLVGPNNIKIIEVVEEDEDTDAYESIDEIPGEFVAPMNGQVEISHRKLMDDLYEK